MMKPLVDVGKRIKKGTLINYILSIIIYSLSSIYLTYTTSLVIERLIDLTLASGFFSAMHVNQADFYLLGAAVLVYHVIMYWKNTAYNQINYEVSTTLFCSIVDTPYELMLDKDSGSLYSSLKNDVPLYISLFTSIEALITKAAVSIGSAFYIFHADYRMGLVIFGFGCIILAYNQLIAPVFKKIQTSIQIDNSEVEKYTTDQYRSFLPRKFFDFSMLSQKYEEAYQKFINTTLKKQRYSALTAILGYLIGFLQTYVPLLLMATLFHGYTIGELISVIANITAYIAIFRAIGALVVKINQSLAGAERLQPLLANGTLKKTYATSKTSDVDANTVYDILDLTYQYEKDSFKLTIPELKLNLNQKIGIVGEKGSGKSTLLKLMAGLITKYDGCVALYGKDCKQTLPNEFSKYVSYLPQNFPVFDGTIIENFRMVAPHKTEEEYMCFAAMVHMDKEIMQMENGIHTRIDSQRLSTGQRQRLSMCMVLLRETPIILMDEPVANLDIANQAAFAELMDVMSRNKLLVVATHDTSILTDFTKVYCMRDGVLQ